MKKWSAAVCISAATAIVLSMSPAAVADQSSGDPYEDGPLVSRVDWCSQTFSSKVAEAAEWASYYVEYAFWVAFEEVWGIDPPELPKYTPVVNNADGCARARAYDANRAQRAAIRNDQGPTASLWQNRPMPNQLDSQDTPPDFVVVGFGDSFASGEGNPANPTTWQNDHYQDVTWTDFTDYPEARSESDDPVAAGICHRSSASGFANAMLELRRQYPAVNVYWRNFACSGAETRHIWKDSYAPWKFLQAQDEAGVGSSDSDGTAYQKVVNSNANQDTQINQASTWLDSFAHKRPAVDATYMSIGGNDVFFGPVIGECVSPTSTSGCSSSNSWLKLSQAAIDGSATPDGTSDHWYSLDFNSPGGELIDPLVGPNLPGRQCTTADIAWNGCISHDVGQRWSSLAARYNALADQIKQSLAPNQVYLAEVPDFTRSDDKTNFCGDSEPNSSAGPWSDTDAELKAHDPYSRMNEDWLLSNSEYTDWQYAANNVGQKLVNVIRSVASRDGTNTPKGWRLVSWGPKGDRLFEGWQDKHGVCALNSYVNTFEEAQDTQGEDLDNTLDVSAGSMHPNAFGQQDYAERILYSMEWQLVKKMTPVFTVAAPSIVQTALGPASLTLGGSVAQDTTIRIPWTLDSYPNGDDRVDMRVRVTPITAAIKPVSVRVLGQPGNISYSLDYTKSETLHIPGDETGVEVTVPAGSAGVQVEVRGCGPESYEGDARLCTKWSLAGHYVRSPMNLFDPKAVARIRALDPRMIDATFRASLKAVVTKLAQPGFVTVKTSAGTPKVSFDWKNTLGLTPTSVRDNNWKPPAPRPAPVLKSTYDVPALPSGTSAQDLVDCGVPEQAADTTLRFMRQQKRGTLLGYGHEIANCLQYGGSVSAWPYEPPSGSDILENSCGLAQDQFDSLKALVDDPKTDPGVFEDEWQQASSALQCLQDHGVDLMGHTAAHEPALAACGLTLLDVPLLSWRFAPPPESQEAMNCLRTNARLPARYWYFLTDQ